MQPYFFPYLGYFQLINSVDKFVFLDDVNYINKGWINRNRLLINKNVQYFTVPLKSPSQHVKINQTQVSEQPAKWQDKLILTVKSSYAKAPYRDVGLDILASALSKSREGIADVARSSVISICQYLKLKTLIGETSAVYNNSHLKGEERIIDICLKEKTKLYINAIGGMELYKNDHFEKAGLQLKFIKGSLPAYRQLNTEFLPGLSMLEIVMCCSQDEILEMLSKYELLS